MGNRYKSYAQIPVTSTAKEISSMHDSNVCFVTGLGDTQFVTVPLVCPAWTTVQLLGQRKEEAPRSRLGW